MVKEKLNSLGLKSASKILDEGLSETLSYYKFPQEHWRHLKTNRVVGSFPDGNSALMLVAARLRYITEKNWGTQRYMNMDLLNNMDKEKDL